MKKARRWALAPPAFVGPLFVLNLCEIDGYEISTETPRPRGSDGPLKILRTFSWTPSNPGKRGGLGWRLAGAPQAAAAACPLARPRFASTGRSAATSDI